MKALITRDGFGKLANRSLETNYLAIKYVIVICFFVLEGYISVESR